MNANLKVFLKTNQCMIGAAKAKVELELIEDFLTETCANTNAEKIKTHFASMESLDGKFCQVGLWNLKKRICPKTMDPPMGKKNEDGLLITAPNLLKELYLRTYKNRLKHRNMKESMHDVFFLK